MGVNRSMLSKKLCKQNLQRGILYHICRLLEDRDDSQRKEIPDVRIEKVHLISRIRVSQDS